MAPLALATDGKSNVGGLHVLLKRRHLFMQGRRHGRLSLPVGTRLPHRLVRSGSQFTSSQWLWQGLAALFPNLLSFKWIVINLSFAILFNLEATLLTLFSLLSYFPLSVSSLWERERESFMSGRFVLASKGLKDYKMFGQIIIYLSLGRPLVSWERERGSWRQRDWTERKGKVDPSASSAINCH